MFVDDWSLSQACISITDVAAPTGRQGEQRERIDAASVPGSTSASTSRRVFLSLPD